ncbi:hypothetical protein V8E36_000051 [Tilletia maclaganii]
MTAAMHAEATRAFLQRDYASAIAQTSTALALSSKSALSSSSTSSQTDLTTKLLILRLTALSTLYTSHSTDSVARQQSTLAILQSAASANDTLADAAHIITLDKSAFLAHLWSDVLRVCNQQDASSSGSAPTLQPKDEANLRLALAVPASVLATLIFACLKLDDSALPAPSVSGKKEKLSASTPSLFGRSSSKSAKATGSDGAAAQNGANTSPHSGLHAARSIAEWFLAAYSSNNNNKAGAQPTTLNDSTTASELSPNISTAHRAVASIDEAYSRIMQLYCVHLVGARSAEWEYAAETIGYSVLDDSTKAGLMNELHAEHAKAVSTRERADLLARQLEVERKVSSERVKAAVAAASSSGSEAAGSRGSAGANGTGQPTSSRANGKGSMAKTAHTSSNHLSASTGNLPPSRRKDASPPSPAAAVAKRSDDASSIEGRLTSTLIHAANGDVRKRREREFGGGDAAADNAASAALSLPEGRKEADASSSASRLAGTAAAAAAQAPQQASPAGVGTMIATYFSRSSSSSSTTATIARYLSIIMLVLALAYPRLRARVQQQQRSGTTRLLEAARSGVVAGPGFVGGLARRLWDTVRMGTQVTYL